MSAISQSDGNESPDEDAPPDAAKTDANAVRADDPETQKNARRRKAKLEDQVQAFWQRVFQDPIGRLAMWGILRDGGYGKTTFACGPSGFPQPEATWFHAGERDYVERLFKTWLKHARPGVLAMLDEHHPDFVAARKGART